MIDLSLSETDDAVVNALDRILADARSTGWRTQDGRCALDAVLWRQLTDLIVGDADAPPEERLGLLSYELVAERLGRTLVGLPAIDHIVGLRLLDAIGAPARPLRDAASRRDAVLGLLIPPVQARGRQPLVCLSGAIATSVLRIGLGGAVQVLDPGSQPLKFAENLGDLPVGVAVEDGWQGVAQISAELEAQIVAERKVLVAGAIAGMCDRAIELAVEYANTRELFGAPIGSFQSLSHGLAAAKVQADGSQLLAREAAWARDNEPERFLTLSRMAYAYASAAGDYVTRTAVHIFGGYGLTREYPAQAYFRTARALTLFVGDRRFDLQQVGAEAVQDTKSRTLAGA